MLLVRDGVATTTIVREQAKGPGGGNYYNNDEPDKLQSRANNPFSSQPR